MLNKNPVTRLLQSVIATHGLRYGLYLVIAALAAAVELLPPRVLGYFADNISQTKTLSEASAQDFLVTFGTFGMVVALVLFFTHFGWDLFQESMFLRTESILRRQVLDKLHTMPLDAIDQGQRGEFLTRMTQDLNGVERFIAVTLPDHIKTVLVFVGVTATFIATGGKLAVVLLLSAGVLAYANVLAQKRLRPAMEKLRSLHGGILQLLLENYEGLMTIRSLGAEPYVKRRFEQNLATIVHQGFRLSTVTSLVGGSNGLMTGCLTTLALSYVAWKVAAGPMTVGDALLYPFYIGLFYSSALSLLGIVYSWNGFLVQGGRVSDFLYQPTDLPHRVGLGESAPQEIALKNIHVRHRGMEPLTAKFDLKIKRQEILLIHGPSGSGKTTLMEMLAGLRPFQGGILASQSNVRNLASHDHGLWLLPTEWSLYIEQRPCLFEGTLRSNLLMGKPSVPEERLWEVLTLVHLAGFAAEVGGLDYELRDQGGNLSEGQKYRLIVARALLAERAFYFFDEPFAALDPFSVAAMCNVFLHLSRAGCGVVVVSHTKPDLFRVDRQLDFQGIMTDSVLPSPSHRHGGGDQFIKENDYGTRNETKEC